ncbi:MAG: hypothetical protein EA395_02600 [Phormidium sp. GEM2.Bin31]|nr:hypothetical protein [Phormidium sp. BM_Day4_Bin.17]TVR14441.1 MAG: hypothetical protein EA395_02600 [Phormidium sp. GEM2.Bin31]UCJ14083.1 MAG: hypothetical protein JWS08_10395 [Phormidium sp. PBR-2020]
MSLDRQIQTLVDNAPQDGSTPGAIAAIAPVLKAFADRLRHRDYYILQTPDGNWLMTTLSNRLNADLEKSVVYGFPSFEDAKASEPESDAPQLVAVSRPVTHILFQLLALERVESLIFFETPGERETGVEVKRQDLQQAVALQLQQYRSAPPSNLA